MKVDINKKEYEALYSALDMITTAIEGAGEEFVANYTSDKEGLESLIKKCKVSRDKEDLKRRVSKLLKEYRGKHGV